MKLLLDTHTAVWWIEEDPQLSETALDLVIDESNEVLLSAAVVWEVGVKRSAGKLHVPGDLTALLAFDVSPLPITLEHAAAVEHLPRHHRDPFDRLLVAQAQAERAAIVSRDGMLKRYDVEVVW